MLTRARVGLTLVELLVAIAIGGVLLAVIAGVAVRQQRIFGDLAEAAALESQLREAISLLPIDLRALSPRLGDIREARDTSIELRATIATAIACDTNGSRLLLTPTATSPPTARDIGRYSSFSTPIVAGDTAWLLSASDTTETWTAAPISAVGAAPPGACALRGPSLDPVTIATSRVALTLAALPAGTADMLGAPIRVTRPVRYSLYRASDGDWYLGEREWNAALVRFNGVQPVAGPFLSAAAGGLRFSFLDSAGASLGSPVGDVSRIAAIEIELRGQSRSAIRALAAATSAGGRRTDSLATVIALRGGR